MDRADFNGGACPKPTQVGLSWTMDMSRLTGQSEAMQRATMR